MLYITIYIGQFDFEVQVERGGREGEKGRGSKYLHIMTL